MYRRSCDVGAAPRWGGPEQTMSPPAAIRTVFGDAAAGAIGSAARPATSVRDATAARIRWTRMGGIFPRAGTPCRSGLELGARALLVAVALLGERLGMDVVPPDLPEPPDVLRGELETGQPLRALPGVALRHDEPQRPPVLGGEVLAVLAPRDEHVLVVHRVER